MVGNVFKKSLGAVLIIAAHFVFMECRWTKINKLVGSSITLKFSFNTSITNNSHFAVYKAKVKNEKAKIAEYKNGPFRGSQCGIYAKNGSVCCNFTNLTLNDSGHYLASLFMTSGIPTKESKEVQLIVHEENTSTVTPKDEISTTPGSKSPGSPRIITAVLVVAPVVLLAATLIWLIWSLLKTKDIQEPSPHQNSTPTIQETVEAPRQVPAPPLIYSVLDFPKRASIGPEVNLRDTEYAAVSYLTEKRGM